MASQAEREGARLRRVPALVQPVNPPRDAWALLSLSRIVREFRPHIVHTHTAKAGFVGRAAAVISHPRPLIVHTYHGHVLEGYFGAAKSQLYRRLEALLGRWSDRLIGVSQATVDDLVRLRIAPRERFRVVPLGLDLERYARLGDRERREGRAELGVSDDQRLLTYVGRIVPIKRLDVLLESVHLALRGGAPIRLAVVGDGETRAALERMATALGISARVSFLGYRGDLHAILAATDVAVLSSDNEGTPVSLIEAAAAGVPAVATDVGGVSEVVTRDTGRLAARGDATGLATAISEVAGDDGLRRMMGAKARARACERYSIARLIRDIEALYGELLATRTHLMWP